MQRRSSRCSRAPGAQKPRRTPGTGGYDAPERLDHERRVFYPTDQSLGAEQYDGFNEILPELRRQVIAFPGQSALVHGDSHYVKEDKPLRYDNGQVVQKFTRVETFGAADTHWVALTVDPNDPNQFDFSPRIVAANVNDR